MVAKRIFVYSFPCNWSIVKDLLDNYIDFTFFVYAIRNKDQVFASVGSILTPSKSSGKTLQIPLSEQILVKAWFVPLAYKEKNIVYLIKLGLFVLKFSNKKSMSLMYLCMYIYI